MNDASQSIQTSPSEVNYRHRNLHLAFWLLAAILGGMQAWVSRHLMNPDGIAYLDVADAYFRGDWAMAVNGYWNPLYPWLLGAAMFILKPPMYWEFALAHFVNFIIYLSTLGCFSFFLHELINFNSGPSDRTPDNAVTLPYWGWVALGYTAFISSSLYLITVSVVTPDMCVAASVYLASGILVRIRRGIGNRLMFASLGTALGFGYLAKAVMLPLGLLYITVAAFLVKNLRKAASHALLAFITLALIAMPLIIGISDSKGRITFSESGKLNYAWHVNKVPFFHWQGDPPGTGIPEHATRKVLNSPPIYEFANPVGGTYPVWYDPSYWYDGITQHFDLKRQLRRVKLGLQTYYHSIFFSFRWQALTIGFLILLLYATGGSWRLCLRGMARVWFLLAPSVAVLIMYLVVYLDTRYVGASVVVLWMALFSGVQLPNNQASKKLGGAVAATLALALFCSILTPSLRDVCSTIGSIVKGEERVNHIHWQVADGLKKAGVQPGDKIAYIGYSFGASWARLARVQIIAELPERSAVFDDSGLLIKSQSVDEFWKADISVRNKAVEAFAKTGAKIIVAENLPGNANASGWERIGVTDYYFYTLAR